MNIINFESPHLNNQEKLDISVFISRFLEKIAYDNKLDVQNVMMWYDRRSSVLEVIERTQPPVVLCMIRVNDL